MSPGPDLRYLSGYDAIPLERLTCLVAARRGPSRSSSCPNLEVPAAAASPLGGRGRRDPRLGRDRRPVRPRAPRCVPHAKRVAVDDHMWAEKVLALRDALPDAEQVLAGTVLREIRMRKTRRRGRGAARGRRGDRLACTPRSPSGSRPDAPSARSAPTSPRRSSPPGHADRRLRHRRAPAPTARVPHHELSDRVIQPGDPVVVDIGGTTPEGYCSDETRTYSVGVPPAEFLASYEVLQEAQEAACRWASAGGDARRRSTRRHATSSRPPATASCSSTAPATASGSRPTRSPTSSPATPRSSSRAWPSRSSRASTPGSFGARIEDIVVCTDDGVRRLNLRPRELVVLDA